MTDFKILTVMVLGLAFSLPASAKLYKWVDNKGVTHYGETIPPEYANKDRKVLNKSGRVTETIDVETREEREANREAEEKKLADEKLAEEKRRRDETLMATYSNIKEIDLARERNLQQVNARIVNDTSQLKMVTDKLAELQAEVDEMTKSGKKVPFSLHEDISETQARVDKMKLNLEKSRAEKAAVVARYDDDKKRYHELTGKE
jgi:DNA primase catalytic subunit